MTNLGGGEAWFLSLGLVAEGALEVMFAERGERHSFMSSTFSAICASKWCHKSLDISS